MPNYFDDTDFIGPQEQLEILNLQRTIAKLTKKMPYDYVDLQHLTPVQGAMMLERLAVMELRLRKALKKEEAACTTRRSRKGSPTRTTSERRRGSSVAPSKSGS